MTLIILNENMDYPGDSIEVDETMNVKETSLTEAKEMHRVFYRNEPKISHLGIPTIDGSIISSFKKSYYKNFQQVIDILKKYEPEDYEVYKKNFPDIFEDLKKQGYKI